MMTKNALRDGAGHCGTELASARSRLEVGPLSVQNVQLSVLTCCYKYVQRLRVFLYALARQDLPFEDFEVVVTDPCSPDGVAQYLDTFKQAIPRMNLVRVTVPHGMRRHKPWMLNRAFECCKGATVMLTDCDVIMPPGFLRTMLASSRHRPQEVLGVYRNLLSPGTTAAILTGLVDPVACFAQLAREDNQEKDGYRGVLGYCQVVPRDVMVKTPYPEEFVGFGKSDVAFVERLAAEQGVRPGQVPELRMLHLWHPRNWEGTDECL